MSVKRGKPGVPQGYVLSSALKAPHQLTDDMVGLITDMGGIR